MFCGAGGFYENVTGIGAGNLSICGAGGSVCCDFVLDCNGYTVATLAMNRMAEDLALDKTRNLSEKRGSAVLLTQIPGFI